MDFARSAINALKDSADAHRGEMVESAKVLVLRALVYAILSVAQEIQKK